MGLQRISPGKSQLNLCIGNVGYSGVDPVRSTAKHYGGERTLRTLLI